MFLTLSVEMRVSFFCHAVRWLSPPSVSQLALPGLFAAVAAGACAPGTAIHTAAQLASATDHVRRLRLMLPSSLKTVLEVRPLPL